jgi:hypothetical protein
MQKLDSVVKISGTGIAGLTATLVERTKRKAMYLRSDGCYEVFKIRIAKACTIEDREYPEREVYPSNEDFGKFAWAFNSKDLAYERYQIL